MNTTTSSSSAPAAIFSPTRIGRLGYSLSISIAFLLLIVTITLMSCFCTRTAASNDPRRDDNDDTEEEDIEAGLDEATLKSYPKLAYSKAKEMGIATDCSICLADYKDSDVLRLLPECGHALHLKCVDPWLRLRPTCPVCRSTPVPSPLPTPLAEVVPIAEASSSRS